MEYKSHCILMAKYNQRLNSQVYEVAKLIDKRELERDVGAFFKSILGTLNHILVGDIIWLSRFATHSATFASLARLSSFPQPERLDQILYADISDLFVARKEIDSILLNWVKADLENADCSRNLVYHNTKGRKSSRNFGELVFHFFNHQTHHRGQVSVLLSQLGYDIGVTDFLMDIPEQV